MVDEEGRTTLRLQSGSSRPVGEEIKRDRVSTDTNAFVETEAPSKRTLGVVRRSRSECCKAITAQSSRPHSLNERGSNIAIPGFADRTTTHISSDSTARYRKNASTHCRGIRKSLTNISRSICATTMRSVTTSGLILRRRSK